MSALNDYENGIAKYYNSLSLKYYPLVNWDFSLANFNKLSKAMIDVQLLHKMTLDFQWNIETSLFEDIKSDTVLVVTDKHLNIVYASHNMYFMNGYLPKEVIGKSPKMFQGQKTCAKTSQEIREAINAAIPFEKEVVNYSKNGKIYNCQIKGLPIFNNQGQLIHFMAFEKVA
jgi:PAS domain S-box-containing protein